MCGCMCVKLLLVCCKIALFCMHVHVHTDPHFIRDVHGQAALSWLLLGSQAMGTAARVRPHSLGTSLHAAVVLRFAR